MTEAEIGINDGQKTYGAFVSDLKAQHLEILPGEDVQAKIRLMRDPSISDTERDQLRTEVINSNLRIIPFMLKERKIPGVGPEELVGEAFEVLNNCINNYKEGYVSPKSEEPAKFSTYFIKSLEEALKAPQSLAKVEDTITAPRNADNIASMMRRAWEACMQELHHEPSPDEWYMRTIKLAAERKLSLATVEQMTPEMLDAVRKSRISIVKRIGKTSSRGNVAADTLEPLRGTIENTLVDPGESLDEIVEREDLATRIEEQLGTLTLREKNVLQLVYGLGLNEEGKKKEPLTLDQVGFMYGVGRERIRQIRDKALRKMRHPMRSKHLRNYYEDMNANVDFQQGIRTLTTDIIRNCSSEQLEDLLQKVIDSPTELDKEELLVGSFKYNDSIKFLQKRRIYYRSIDEILKMVVSEINVNLGTKEGLLKVGLGKQIENWIPFKKIEMPRMSKK